MKKQFDHQRFAGLEFLPVSILEEIIRADFNGEAQHDDELIEYVLHLIAVRKKETQIDPIPNQEESWQNLLERLEEQEEELPASAGKQLKKGRKRTLRYVGTIAACLALIFAAMITVQAMGVNIFGTLGTWTASRFSFVKKETQSTPPVSTAAEETNVSFRRALEHLDFPTELQPKWIPERYERPSLELFEFTGKRGVTAYYCYPDGKYQMRVDIAQYDDEGLIYNGLYEKYDMEPEPYTGNGRTFYLFTDAKTWLGIWTDTNYAISISGVETKEEIMKIIDSIGE